jgi:methyl-accepting chemotaxis protein
MGSGTGEVAAAARQQAGATLEIARNTQRAAAAAGEVAREIATFRAETEVTDETALCLSAAAAGLAEQAARLQQEAERMTGRSAEAA